ncbi:MAG: hypothetical protein J6S61_02090 [Elusimicrobiaceae bacterium]|nr:hypothetical protein [Elusimicrobiaceae bacterium]
MDYLFNVDELEKTKHSADNKDKFKQEKQNFLSVLLEADTLTEALENSALPKNLLFTFLFDDKNFLKQFDKIINLKLEIALVETALKAKAANILSFSLMSRLPNKYNKNKKENSKELQEPQITKIIYDEQDEDYQSQ